MVLICLPQHCLGHSHVRYRERFLMQADSDHRVCHDLSSHTYVYLRLLHDDSRHRVAADYVATEGRGQG